MVRQALRALLESDPDVDVVGEADDGVVAVEMAERLRPDVLVADVAMPGLSGIDMAPVLASRAPGTRVVVLSMHAEVDGVARALKNGAAAYVLKDSGFAELAKAVRAAACGRRYLGAPLSERSIESYLSESAEDSDDPRGSLTARERQILSMEASGWTAARIGETLSISPRTVEAHRAKLLRKLGLRSKAHLVRWASERAARPVDDG